MTIYDPPVSVYICIISSEYGTDSIDAHDATMMISEKTVS